MYYSTAAGAIGGVGTVDGFIANTANYSALSEPWVTIGSSLNGTSVRQSPWVLDVSAS
jgi:cellulose 1,4-beta-cellobiosidase